MSIRINQRMTLKCFFYCYFDYGIPIELQTLCGIFIQKILVESIRSSFWNIVLQVFICLILSLGANFIFELLQNAKKTDLEI